MKKNISKSIITTALLSVPALVFAQQTTIKTVACLAVGYIVLFVYLIVALAVLVFVWNVYRYFIVADPSNKKEAGLYVLYSVIGFFVILSLWGLVALVTNSLTLSSGTTSSFSVMPSVGSCGTTGSTSYPNSNQTDTVSSYPNSNQSVSSYPNSNQSLQSYPNANQSLNPNGGSFYYDRYGAPINGGVNEEGPYYDRFGVPINGGN